VQGKDVPFSIVVVPQPRTGQPLKFVVQVPANATLTTNVRIQTVDADPGIAAPFARCGPTGCFADFELGDAVLRKFRTASGTGMITYADFTGHAVTVPLALSGFDQAFEALAKQ
jgi:invasion protein IalB